MNLVELFCDVDDFCQCFLPVWHQQLIESNPRKRQYPTRLSDSEIMTIVIHFHQSGYRNFKVYYLHYVCKSLTDVFPGQLSYTRFVERMSTITVPLCAYLTQRHGQPTGITFIDSTCLCVCHNLRIPRHLVFKDIARRGRTSTGWFYGFKLHLLINHLGEILAVKLTAGNTDDRVPVPELVKELTGMLYGDKGYLSKRLTAKLQQQNLR